MIKNKVCDMKIGVKILMSLAMSLLFCSCVEEGYDVYLCIGQSNMAGRGTLIEADTAAVEGVWLLNGEGEPVSARHPMNRYSTIRKDISVQQMSPSFRFATEMYRLNGRKVLLVVNARGGTGVDSWQKDAPVREDRPRYFDEAVRRTREALQYGELKGIIWHQGESDEKNPDGYAERLARMMADLRAELGAGQVPVVVGEIARWLPYTERINSQIHRAVTLIPMSACVSSEGCGMLRDESDPHFNREGELLLGERYAEQMILLQQSY